MRELSAEFIEEAQLISLHHGAGVVGDQAHDPLIEADPSQNAEASTLAT